MITIIRIKGMVDVPRTTEEALTRMRLRRKYSCVLAKNEESLKPILKKIRNCVAYGEVDDDTAKKLIEARGKTLPGKKLNVDKVLEELMKEGRSSIIKPFFRLHPPRKGIESKTHYPKGALGNHGKEISKLLLRML